MSETSLNGVCLNQHPCVSMQNFDFASMKALFYTPYTPLISSNWVTDDIKFMRKALDLAKQGAQLGEVPVGAVLVFDNEVIGTGFNQPISTNDPTAHAEIVALRAACRHLKNYRLPFSDTRNHKKDGELKHTTLYVTLEPCTMCMGALIHARLGRIVFATSEPRAGMAGSQMNLARQPFYNHNIEVQSGLMAQQSSEVLKAFFRRRRRTKKYSRHKS